MSQRRVTTKSDGSTFDGDQYLESSKIVNLGPGKSTVLLGALMLALVFMPFGFFMSRLQTRSLLEQRTQELVVEQQLRKEFQADLARLKVACDIHVSGQGGRDDKQSEIIARLQGQVEILETRLGTALESTAAIQVEAAKVGEQTDVALHVASTYKLGVTMDEFLHLKDVGLSKIGYTKLLDGFREYAVQDSLINFGPGPTAQFRMSTVMGDITFESAPFQVMPHATNYFLHLVDSGFYDGCSFIRNADHVLQLNCNARNPPALPRLAYQEYNPEYAHEPYTAGLAGFPASHDWYINLKDNTQGHQPGGQGVGSRDQANPCFAKIVDGFDVVTAIHELPRKNDGFQALIDEVIITRMEII